MRLLEFAQLANNTLGTVDTARNLLTVPQGNGSVSGLSQQINNVGAAITSEIRGVGAALQQDIHTVNNMVAQTQAQQVALRQEIQQVLTGVAGLNALMKKHMTAVEDQLRFVIEEPVQNACYQLTAYLTNKEGVGATDEEIRTWLRVLENWISKNFSPMRKTVTITSEDAVQFLSQFPDNIWFIASRMHLLFGNLIPEKFLSLPPVSLKFYFTVITLYLNGLKKNPHLMGTDKAASISQEIQNTLNLYLDFSKFLKDNPQIIQALFDRYNYFQSKNASQPLLNELRSLIKAVVAIMEDAKFNKKLAPLEAEPNRQLIAANSTGDIWDQLPKTLPESERVKKLFGFLSQENAPKVVNSKYMILSEAAPYLPIPSTIVWADLGNPPDENNPQWGGKNFPYRPKQAAFCTNSLLLLCLASGYADSNLLRTTLKQHVGQLISRCSTSTNTQTIVSGRFERRVRDCYSWGDDWHWAEDRPEWKSNSVGNMANTQTRYNPGIYRSYAANPGIHGGYRANIFQYHAGLSDILPAEYAAILNSVTNGILKQDKLNIAFKYFVIYSSGDLQNAKLFAEKNPIDHYCLLFLTAITGRWDIFENYLTQKPAPINFNYAITAEIGSLTPLMFAAQCGHADVVDGLLRKMNFLHIENRSSDNKTAEDFARANGFTAIADKIKSATPGGRSAIRRALMLQRGIALAARNAVPAAPQNPVAIDSDYEKGLKEILSTVSTSKITLGQYVPPPPPAQQVAAAAQAADPFPDDVTDVGQDNFLDEDINEFFKTEKIAAGTNTFFPRTRPDHRPHNRPGYRYIPGTLFGGDSRRRSELHKFLKHKKHHDVSAVGDQLLVKLPLGSPPKKT